MPCIDCVHGALRDAKSPERDKALRKMARAGFVNCARSDHGASFFPAQHVCPTWKALEPELAQVRQRWLSQQQAA